MRQTDRAELLGLFAARLRKLMHFKGLSEADFCDLSGIDEGNLWKYLSGKRAPTLPAIEIMANALAVTSMDLIDTGFKVRGVEGREHPNR